MTSKTIIFNTLGYSGFIVFIKAYVLLCILFGHTFGCLQKVRSVRSGYGLHPRCLSDGLEKRFVKDCKKGDRLSLDLVE